MLQLLAAAMVVSTAQGVTLSGIAWPEAEKVLTPQAVVVIPLGAAAKEHGPHLTLANDLLLAEALAARVKAARPVVVAPTINYGYYPAFTEYPGSTSLRLETARDLVVDVCRSLARFGPRRFYVLNTGISTVEALEPAAKTLAAEGILLRFTDLHATEAVEKTVRQEEGGTHADEIETSMMLYLAPDAVDMTRAVKDFHGDAPGPLTRDPKGEGVYSPSGVWGDATLATREKGKVVAEALISAILADLDALRSAPLPPVSSPATVAIPAAPPSPGPAPHDLTLWADGSAGVAATNQGAGVTAGLGLSYLAQGEHLLSLRWLHYDDRSEWVRANPSDAFDTIAVLYGRHSRSEDLFLSLSGGLGYSAGTGRGDLLFSAPDGTQWYRPVRYSALSAVGHAFLGLGGFAGNRFTAGLGATVDANALRQTWSLQLTFVYGSLPEAW